MLEKRNSFELLYFGIYEYPIFCYQNLTDLIHHPLTIIFKSVITFALLFLFFIKLGFYFVCEHVCACSGMHTHAPTHTHTHSRTHTHTRAHTHVCHIGYSIQWCVIAVTICVNVYMVRGVAHGSLPVVPCVFCGSSYLAHLVSLQPIWHLCLEVFCICDSRLFLYIIMKLFIVHDNY